MEQPRRKKNRLEYYDYSQNGAYFITICTENRKCLLSTVVGAISDRPYGINGYSAYERICDKTDWP